MTQQIFINYLHLPVDIIENNIDNMYKVIPVDIDDIRNHCTFSLNDNDLKSFNRFKHPKMPSIANDDLVWYIYQHRPELLLLWNNIGVQKLSKKANVESYHFHVGRVYLNDDLYNMYMAQAERELLERFYNNINNIFTFNHSLIKRIQSINVYPIAYEVKLSILWDEVPEFTTFTDIKNYDINDAKFNLLISCNYAIILEITEENLKHLKLDQRFVDDYLNEANEKYTNNIEEFFQYYNGL